MIHTPSDSNAGVIVHRRLRNYRLLFQHLSCFHGPEDQIELVEVYADIEGEPDQLLLHFEILPSC